MREKTLSSRASEATPKDDSIVMVEEAASCETACRLFVNPKIFRKLPAHVPQIFRKQFLHGLRQVFVGISPFCAIIQKMHELGVAACQMEIEKTVGIRKRNMIEHLRLT